MLGKACPIGYNVTFSLGYSYAYKSLLQILPLIIQRTTFVDSVVMVCMSIVLRNICEKYTIQFSYQI